MGLIVAAVQIRERSSLPEESEHRLVHVLEVSDFVHSFLPVHHDPLVVERCSGHIGPTPVVGVGQKLLLSQGAVLE